MKWMSKQNFEWKIAIVMQKVNNLNFWGLCLWITHITVGGGGSWILTKKNAFIPIPQGAFNLRRPPVMPEDENREY